MLWRRGVNSVKPASLCRSWSVPTAPWRKAPLVPNLPGSVRAHGSETSHITRDQPCVKVPATKSRAAKALSRKSRLVLRPAICVNFNPRSQPEARWPDLARGDQLCDHRIIIGRDLPTLRHAGFHPQARSKDSDDAAVRLRAETPERIFRIERASIECPCAWISSCCPWQ